MNDLKNTAVILIDMQSYFADDVEMFKRQEIIQGQINILKECAEKNIPVIVLELDDRGRTLAILDCYLKMIRVVKYVTKNYNDGFCGTNLNRILKELGIKTLILMGINAGYCVKATAISTIAYGYKIITADNLIANGHYHKHDYPEWFMQNGVFLKSPLRLDMLRTETQLMLV